MANNLYTIGYAGFPNINDFVNTLKKYQIQILIDVRSSPYSAYFEVYNKNQLSQTLKENGIYYYNYARQFGARQEDTSFYKNGRLDFSLLSKSAQFIDGVLQVEKSRANIVFLCAEKDPCECHRAILVAKAFYDRGHEVIHIIPDGETITQHDIETTLVNRFFPDRAQGSLFEEENMTEEEYVAAAYEKQNEKIGFKLEDLRS